jgi:putative membrane protein
MMQILLRLTINALSLAAAIKMIDGIMFTGEWWKILFVAAIFGIVNALIKPVVRLFSIPFILLTLGLFTLVINAAMLGLTALLSGPFGLGFSVAGFWPALWGALVISIVSTLLSWLIGSNK